MRGQFSSDVMDRMVGRDGWTRDVPLGFQRDIFPGITPARESVGGRGAVYFDVWRRTQVGGLLVDQAAGFKVVTDLKKNNTMILTKGTLAHVEAIAEAASSGAYPLPVIVLSARNDQWIATSFDLCKLVREHGIQRATEGQGKGRGKANVVSYGETIQTTRKKDKSGGIREYKYNYLYLQVNIASADLDYQVVDHPSVWDFSGLCGTYLR